MHRALLPIFVLFLICSSPLSAGSKAAAQKVFGKIQIVKSFPDYRVRVVKANADLDVEIVKSFPDRAGKWQIVDSFPDFKIQFVTVGEDFTIKWTSAFPGPAGGITK